MGEGVLAKLMDDEVLSCLESAGVNLVIGDCCGDVKLVGDDASDSVELRGARK